MKIMFGLFLVLCLAIALPAAAQAGNSGISSGIVLAQAPPGGQPPGGQPQGGGDPCLPSFQKCVMMCAGVGNCVNNCNLGYAACQQNRGGGGGKPPKK